MPAHRPDPALQALYEQGKQLRGGHWHNHFPREKDRGHNSASLFSQNLEHLNCVSPNVHLVQEAELDTAQRTMAKLHDDACSTNP